MNKRINVYIMYAISFLQGLIFYGAIATLYRQNRGLSLSNIFLIESISWILMIIFEIPWGGFADRFGYKKILIIANFLLFISKIIFYKANGFLMFLLERVLLSIALSGISGCDIALIYSSIEKEESKRVFSIYGVFSNGGYLVSSCIFTILIRYSMEITVLCTIVSYGLAAILTLFIRDVNIESYKKSNFKESFIRAIRNTKVIVLVISWAFINEVTQVIEVFLNQSQYLRCGIDIKYFGILTVIMQIARLLAVKSHKLSDKLGENKTIEILYIGIVMSCIVLIFSSSAIETIIVIILICGSSAMISPIILDIQNKNIGDINRATALSIFSIFQDLIGAGSNIIIGKIAEVSINLAFLTCTIICFCAYILFKFYKRLSNN